ncbi:hypothetical protein RMSM_01537 [Rhodopirellula maiorica SM1]|uniref:Uncharacterized protein n=1 Tax=Rhodopirellula maiorica SM1 TaxID=1265738 RepID=M5S1K1_9BACT|nr:hypothetical protein RMSM_01537 [Rhodopirellula maiorica SM1]
MPPPDGSDVLMMGTYNGGGIRLVVFSVAQFLCFGLGSMCLVIWTAFQLMA